MADSKTAFIGGFTDDAEEKVRLSHMLDCMETCARRNIPTATAFLTPREQAIARRILDASDYRRMTPAFAFSGGYEGAERAVLVFVPDWLTPEDYLSGSDSPISALRASIPGQKISGTSLTHRDYLGALMGAGLRRDTVGDLLVREDGCDILLLTGMLPYVRQNLFQAGRTALRMEEISPADILLPELHVKEVHDTVASLRADAIAGAAFSQPRSKAAAAISAGLVTVAHRVCTKPDAPVRSGDALTWRGFGKAVLSEVGGLSKKGRINVRIVRYL